MQLRSAANRASLAEEQAALRREASLRRIATLVAGGVTAGELFSAVAREVSVVLDAPVVTVDRYELEDGLPVSVVVASLEDAQFPVGSRWPLDGPSARAWIYETRLPVRIEDWSSLESTVATAVRQQGISWVVGAPIIVDGAVWGNICAGATGDEPIPDEAESRLADFTDLVSTAIANSDARETAGRLLDEQAALRRVATLVARAPASEHFFSSVAREVASVLKVPGALVERFEADGASVSIGAAYDSDLSGAEQFLGVGARTPPDPGSLTAQVFETHRTARVDDFSTLAGAVGDAARAAGVGSGCAGPIVVNRDLWGMLAVFSRAGTVLPVGTENRLHDFIELVATAIANYEARADLTGSETRARELLEEQAALRRVATLVAEGATPSRVFDAVRREVARMFNIPSTVLMRFDADGMATLLATYGYYLGPAGTRWPLEGDTSAVARVHQTGRAARADYIREEVHGSLAQAARRGGVRYPVAVPVVVEGALWGAMSAGSYGPAPPPADLERRLAEFTELLATAIANAESRADLAASEARARELAEEQAALRRVATLVARGVRPREIFSAVSEEVGRVFGSHYSGVGRFELDGSAVVIVGVSEGIRNIPIGTRWPLEDFLATTAVYRTGRPARNESSDWEEASGPAAESLRELGLVSTVAAPIVVEGNVWGVITVSDAHQRLPPDAEERLAAFTELVATAIANAESRAELAASEARARELASEQAALRRVATLVAQGASPEELFSAVAKEVAGIIDIPVVAIHRYEADGTFTTLGVAGETSLTVGSRCSVKDGGIAGMILATGRPSRKEDFTGPLGDAVRKDLRLPMVGVPIAVEGSMWGFMVAAAAKPGRPIPADAEERLARFTELVATAVSNATTRTELLTSRARVVSAADETRRRLERDLHDGIQQWLVALALRARKAAASSAAGESAVQELSGLADDLVAVTDELREISRGIHPAILSDAGLDDALAALARRSALRVDLDVSFKGRYDPTLEATVYYVAAESITNAVKHAQASKVRVRGGRRDAAIELEISDDGVGGADPRRGTGLIGLKDRVDTLGGTISFASPAGAGTTIRVRLPAGPRDGQDPPPPRSDEAASAPASG